MMLPSVALALLCALGCAAGIKLRPSFNDAISAKGGSQLTSLRIRSVMKLAWPSEMDIASTNLSSLDGGEAPSETDKGFFSEEDCREFQAHAASLKPPDHDAMAICTAYKKVDVAIASFSLDSQGVLVRTSNDTTIKDTFQVYSNDYLAGLFEELLKAGKILGTDNGSGEPRTYFEVIRALLDSGIRTYLHGGFVRDLCRGLSANDVDIGFDASPLQVTEAIRTKFGMGLHHYLPRIGQALHHIPTSDYFKYGTNDTQIEGKPADRNVFGSHLAIDFSMNTLAFDMQCFSEDNWAPCYILDKIGVGLRHALSGIMDMTTPGGKYDAMDFNDFIAYQCAGADCSGLLRVLKFVGRGWKLAQSFRDLIVPVIRVLFRAAEPGWNWQSFHQKRIKAGLEPIFYLRRAGPPGFELLDEARCRLQTPNLENGIAIYFSKSGKPTRHASLKHAVQEATLFEGELAQAKEGICEELEDFCEPVDKMFPTIVSFSQAIVTRSLGSVSNHPCGVNTREARPSIRATLPGWYLFTARQEWSPSRTRDQITNALRDAGSGACPSTIDSGDKVAWGALTKKRDERSKSWYICYMPSDPTDALLNKLLTC